MKKHLYLKLILAILLLTSSVYFAWHNLLYYRPYYLRMQGEVPTQLWLENFVKNTSYLYFFPSESLWLDKDDATPYTLNSSIDDNAYLMHRDFGKEKQYIFSISNTFVALDETGDVTYANEINSEQGLTRMTLTPELENQLEKDLYTFLSPIIDNTEEPLVNLQWLYNLIYPRK
ncbi:MAG: hypothetical protein Q4B80_00525 [Aerococcaceae bacterium]|nr:hypothetical protein [Aerococcaceae bacterium]